MCNQSYFAHTASREEFHCCATGTFSRVESNSNNRQDDLLLYPLSDFAFDGTKIRRIEKGS